MMFIVRTMSIDDTECFNSLFDTSSRNNPKIVEDTGSIELRILKDTVLELKREY